MESKKLKIAICGGGNGAHCFGAIASSADGVDVNILTIYMDEAERWNKSLKENVLTAVVTEADGSKSSIRANPSLVTKDPGIVLKGASIIFIVVPSYAHRVFLETILPHVQHGTLIVGLPGHPGFELQCKYILGEKAKTCAIMGFESLPWACRIVEYGKEVELLGYKDVLTSSLLTGRECKLPFSAAETVQRILGKKPQVKIANNVISITLMSGSIIHPPIMYGRWKNWNGASLKEKPLFYQGATEAEAGFMERLNREILDTAEKMQELKPSLAMSDVVPMKQWYRDHYPDAITDGSSLLTCLITNGAYRGLVHPMKSCEGGFVPDFDYRYTTEDIPFGVVVLKGFASLVNIPTPTMDEIITWAQKKLGKEYLVGSDLNGRDVNDVRAPQTFGINSLDQLLEFFDVDMIYN